LEKSNAWLDFETTFAAASEQNKVQPSTDGLPAAVVVKEISAIDAKRAYNLSMSFKF
jgi:hypothetical protein